MVFKILFSIVLTIVSSNAIAKEFNDFWLKKIIDAGETNEFRFMKKYHGKFFDSVVKFVSLKKDSTKKNRWVIISEATSATKRYIVFCSLNSGIAEKAIDYEPGDEFFIRGKIYDVLLASGGIMQSKLPLQGNNEDIDNYLKRAIAELTRGSLQLESSGCDIASGERTW